MYKSRYKSVENSVDCSPEYRENKKCILEIK